eukprot:3684985-Amphidinium_carterae.1
MQQWISKSRATPSLVCCDGEHPHGRLVATVAHFDFMKLDRGHASRVRASKSIARSFSTDKPPPTFANWHELDALFLIWSIYLFLTQGVLCLQIQRQQPSRIAAIHQ